jgi:hypothetical protein
MPVRASDPSSTAVAPWPATGPGVVGALGGTRGLGVDVDVGPEGTGFELEPDD